jgi:uncharacterized protein (DUF58 family)
MNLKAWVTTLVLMFILGAMFRSALWVTIPPLVLTIALVAHWWRNHALDRVEYRRKYHYTRGFPGEQTSVQIEIENRKLLPISWLRASDPWPRQVAPLDDSVLAPSHIPEQFFLTHTHSLRWFEEVKREYAIQFSERGIYQVGPAVLRSGDLFGIYDLSRELEDSDLLTVFPEVLPLAALELKAEDPFGDLRSRQLIFDDPNRPIGVREYRPEDSFRHVHWAATAHTGELQVKVYQPVSSQVLVVCLNAATLPNYWEGIIPALLEQLVKVSATLVYEGVQRGYAVGIISNGSLAHADHPFRCPPNRSPQQLARLLAALAGVTPFTTTAFEQYLLRAMTDIPFGATLVVVTAYVSDALVETLARLRRYRRHMTLLSLDVTPPPEMAGINVVHLPFTG